MPDTTTLQESSVAAQDDATLTPTQNAEGGAETSGETTLAQVSGQETSEDGKIGPDINLPPELEDTRKQLLRDYHTKTKKLAEDRLRYEQQTSGWKKEADTLQQLMKQEWFAKALESEKSRRNGAGALDIDITDEEFDAIRSDKNAFKKAVLGLAERLVKGKVEPALGDTKNRIDELQTEREFERVASKYPEFRELNEKGEFDAFLAKGYDYETAYEKWLVKNRLSDINALAEKKAQELLNKSREGAIAKGGTQAVKGGMIIKGVKNFDEAFDAVWDAMKRGNKDVTVERGN